MSGPYAIKRSRSKYNSIMGEYTFALVNMQMPDASSDYGFKVITTMKGNAPIAPEHLRRRQATLNTQFVLNLYAV